MVMTHQNTQFWHGQMSYTHRSYSHGMNVNNFLNALWNTCHTRIKFGICIWSNILTFVLQDRSTRSNINPWMNCLKEPWKNYQKCPEYGLCTLRFWKNNIWYRRLGLSLTGRLEIFHWPNIKKYGSAFLSGRWN